MKPVHALLAVLVLTACHVPAAPPPELTATPPPSSGQLTGLWTGHPVQWNGGKDRNTAVTLEMTFTPARKLQGLDLKSVSPNIWWSIAQVEVEAQSEGQKNFVRLFDRPWYTRDQKEAGRREYELNCTWKPVECRRLRLILRRPHKFIHLQLDSIRPVESDALELNLVPARQAYRAGQTVKAVLEFNSTFARPVENARITISAVGTDGDRGITVWEKNVTLPVGRSSIDAAFAVPPRSDFRLEATVTTARGTVFRTDHASPELTVMPPRSRYWMPIGTAHGSEQSGALGFTVRHDWGGVEKLTDRKLRAVLDSGLVLSNCNLDFDVPEKDRFMINAEGETVKRASFHAPRKLKESTARALDKMNGHPGLFEVVYYNEHGYHTWHVKGLCDYNPYTLAVYRRRLGERYGTIARLNALYGTAYRTFTDVQPPKKFSGPAADWFDWMEFRRYSYGEYLKEAYRLVKPHLPDTRITPKPINFDYFAASGANDPWLYRDACDVFGYDIYPFQREGYLDPAMSLDFHRTQVGDKDIHFLESNFEFRRPNQTEKTAADMLRLYWPAFLRGLKGVYFYCWHQPWTKNHRGFWLREDDGTLTPQGRGAAIVAKEAQTLAPVLRDGKVLGIETAIYFPWEDISQIPNTAPINAIYGAYKMMTQLHYPTEFVTWHNLLAGDLKKYRVLILPMTGHLRPEAAAAITAFVRNGGLLIGDSQCGRFDQYHRRTDALAAVFGVTHLDNTDQNDSFTLKKGDLKVKISAPITRESPFGWRNRANIAPIPRAEKVKASPDADVLGTFADGTPAVIAHRFGRGRTLYFAATFFNSYRNYFYTLCTLPNPATRGNEIINVGDRNSRTVVGNFLRDNQFLPPADVDAGSPDIEADHSPFLILSLYGNRHCVLFGVTNWGPHAPHQVKARIDLPFDRVRKVYCLDTLGETFRELPFELKGRRLNTTIPWLRATQLLIVINDRGPLLAQATQSRDGGPVKVTVTNYLAEKASGHAQVRLDGVVAPMSKPHPFTIEPGQTATFELPLLPPDRTALADRRGEKTPWYVWLTYDGDARSFARVKFQGDCIAP